MTALMSVEVASNASNLLMDIKPGYMLGAKPRQQAIGHVIGIVAGALASTPLFYVALPVRPQARARRPGRHGVRPVRLPLGVAVEGRVGPGHGGLLRGQSPDSELGRLVRWSSPRRRGLVFEIVRIASNGRFPLSPLAFGLGVSSRPIRPSRCSRARRSSK